MPLLLGVLLIVGLGSVPAAVFAQESTAKPSNASAERPEADPEVYRTAIELGVEEFRLGNYEEARSRFLDAHSAFPNARTLRALAKVEYELKRYVRSIEYAQQALASETRRLEDSMRADIEELLEKARGYVATYTVHLKPSEAELRLDGACIDLGEEGRLSLTIGEHTLEARAPGYHQARESVTVQARKERTLRLDLEPLDLKNAEQADTDAVAEKRSRRRRWWVALGVAVAAGAATAIALSLRTDGLDRAEGGNSGRVVTIPDQATFR